MSPARTQTRHDRDDDERRPRASHAPRTPSRCDYRHQLEHQPDESREHEASSSGATIGVAIMRLRASAAAPTRREAHSPHARADQVEPTSLSGVDVSRSGHRDVRSRAHRPAAGARSRRPDRDDASLFGARRVVLKKPAAGGSDRTSSDLPRRSASRRPPAGLRLEQGRAGSPARSDSAPADSITANRAGSLLLSAGDPSASASARDMNTRPTPRARAGRDVARPRELPSGWRVVPGVQAAQ